MAEETQEAVTEALMSDVVMCPECGGHGHVGWADAPETCTQCWGAGHTPKHLFETVALYALAHLDDEFDEIPF